MWGKVLQLFMSAVGLPLLEKLFKGLMDWWNNKRQIKQIVEEIEKEAEKITESKTEQEQKDALKEFVEGVRRRRSQL